MSKGPRRVFALLICFSLVVAALAACAPAPKTGPPATPPDAPPPPPPSLGSGDKEWAFEAAIAEPISVAAGQADVRLGDLERDGISILIPAGALPDGTTLTLKHPELALRVASSDLEPIGLPIAIDTGGLGSVRLAELATVTFALPPAVVDGVLDPEAYYAVYTAGEDWYYIRPSEIDLEAGWMSFETAHFSIFGYGRKTAEKRIADYTQNQAVASWTDDVVNDSTKGFIKDMVTQTMDSLGMTDELNRAVFEGIMTDGEYGKMVRAIQEGKMESFYESYSVAVGKYLARTIETKEFADKLTDTLGWAGDLSTLSKAAGAAAAGEYRQAAKELGSHITEALIKKNVLLRGAHVIGQAWVNTINQWKDQLVQDAYIAYRDGVNGRAAGLFGYREIGPGDFDAVWDQLNVAARELILREVDKQDEDRLALGMDPLTPDEIEGVRRLVYERTKSDFERRVASERAIADKQAIYQQMVGEFMNNSSILDDYLRPKNWLNYRSSAPSEERLDNLFAKLQQIMQDTNTTGLTNERFSTGGKLSLGDLRELTEYLVSGDRKAYVDRVNAIFDIELVETEPPNLSLNGRWMAGHGMAYRIQGSRAVLYAMGGGMPRSVAAGLVKVGTTKLAGISQVSELQWRCVELWAWWESESSPIRLVMQPGTITMSSDGKTITVTSVGPLGRTRPTTYTRQPTL